MHKQRCWTQSKEGSSATHLSARSSTLGIKVSSRRVGGEAETPQLCSEEIKSDGEMEAISQEEKQENMDV